ncbi:transmembrane protein, putative (macronuclear) [Tetrahymena thermophila SB210]|uniref:Transmembrane protein, putative n=1 Tax=Tetrahymena thermophila (strain SB210) TaxID=312017 RepID=Q23R73_TETTS|nr:transmembrane protein, putative [Tetrahymena thermophila SB210]EAR99175.1 transmembrane protein, putative [Tetrahymena thermophila SB210]|eukprot:XP_001019420.1 transmembrane protein, putative [Tetrahymena thermophila SB210]
MDQNISKFIDRKPLKDNPISILGQPVAPSMNLDNENMDDDDNQFNQNQPKSKSNIRSLDALSQDSSPNKLNSGKVVSDLVPQQQNPQMVSVKISSSKKKWIIGLTALVIIGVILGGVLAYKLKTDNRSDEYKEVIKIPANYNQYKESILSGQNNNLVKIIQVPKSQKIYEYKLYNNQTTVQGDGQKKITNSLIVHQFGLVCSNVTEDEFQMFIYIIDTKMYENNNLNNQLTGFPGILEKEQAAAKRNLKQSQKPEDVANDSSEFRNKQSDNALQNEYAPLNDEEIKMLAQKGITPEQFYQSRYPIIYFTLDKNSKVKEIQQPINLRLDIFQIYLNIIEQVTPIVKSDFYQITDQNGNKKRMLSMYTQRILSGEEVNPKLTASIDEHGQANLSKQFEQNKVNSNDSSQSQDYSQNSVIQNGSLLESSAKSNFKMDDHKVDENGDMPLFKGIEMNSECKIAFIRQDDKIDDNLFNLIHTTFNYMSVLPQTLDEALDTYNSVFNTSTQNGNSHTDLDGEKINGRILENKGASLSPAIQKPIFRKNIAAFEFGADVRSECNDSGFIGKEDICTVGLYSYFNGASIKIVEKQTRVNVSKILKLYQYIQHLLKDKLDLIKDKVNGRLTTIKNDIDGLMDELEIVISIDKNPVLKEIYDVVNNDELQIFNLIADLEQFLKVTVSNITKLIKDPLGTLKERMLGFLSSNNISIENQINHIQSFLIDRLAKMKKLIDLAQTTGIPSSSYQQIYLTLENLEDVLIQIIDEPLKQYLDQVEGFILEQTNTMFASINEVDKSISSLNPTQTVANRLKKIIGTSQIVDTLKSFISKTVKTIGQQYDLSDLMAKALKQSINSIKQEIYQKLEDLQQKFPSSSQNALSNPEIDQLLSDFSNITNFAVDLTSGIKELKEDVIQLVQTVKKLQEKKTLSIITDLIQQLSQFPTDLLQKLTEQGKETISKAKDVGSQMKEHILNWKDNLVEKCKKLLSDLSDIYADVKKFLRNTDFPEDDPNYYKAAIFDEVQDIVESVQSIIHYNYDAIGQTFKRFSQIPDKFIKFVNDLKLLGQRCMNYFGDIKIAFTQIYIDEKEAWSELRSLFEQPKEDIRQQIQLTIETEYNQNLNKKAIPEINNDINGLMNKDLAAYKGDVQQNNFDVQTLYKDLIHNLIVEAQFEKIIETPPLSIPFEYVYMYPTPIGVTLKLRLYASWDNSLRFKLAFYNATLDVAAGLSTKVTIGGEVGATVFVAEVGGYAEGTFLDTSLMLGLTFKVLEKFKGSFYIDATFSPYYIKMGLYYKTIFSIEVFKCAAERRRNLGILSAIGGFLKSTVGAVLKNSKNPIAKLVNKAINCLATLEIGTKRHDIFEPLSLKGETYKKRLYEVEFGPLQKNI